VRRARTHGRESAATVRRACRRQGLRRAWCLARPLVAHEEAYPRVHFSDSRRARTCPRSGSTLVSKLLYRVVNLLDSRTKPATLFHYRAVGSGTGRSELGVTGGVATASVQNQFAASDVPLTQAQNGGAGAVALPTYLQFPVVTAQLGIFVNVPVGTNGYVINAAQCLLNDIFSGRCTTWDCAAIKALNPNLVVPLNQPIYLGVRSDRSGSSQVFSAWLSGTTAACAPSEGAASSHLFGVGVNPYLSSSISSGNNFFYSNSATAVPGAAAVGVTGSPLVPSNVAPQSGTQAMVTFVQNNLWSIAYIDNGQGAAAGLLELGVRNPSGAYVQSVNSNPSASVPSTLPYPDGSTAASPTPNNAIWPTVSLFDINVTNAFPITTLVYIIIPSAAGTLPNAYDGESVGALFAFLQYLYYPEIAVGYSATCGYSGGALVSPLTAVPYSCAAYTSASVVSGFNFGALPAAYTVTVLAALAAGATSGILQFGSSTAAFTFFSANPIGVLGAPVPVWTFEPTEAALTVGSSNPGGSNERVISYNRMSYADFQRTSNAEQISDNMNAIATLQSQLIGTAGTTLGDRSIVYRLYGSGASLSSKLMWYAMNLLMVRAKQPVRMTYRSIGSGSGRNEFIGANANYVPWGHYGASDATMPAAQYTALTVTNNKQMLTIPNTVAAVGVFHTIPVSALPLSSLLNMTATIVCKIYTGQITVWSDAAIKAINPAFNPPTGQAIGVVTRGDSSGTTQVFTAWMATTCPTIFTLTGTAGSGLPTWAGITPLAQPGSAGVTNFMAPAASALSPTFTNPWAIAYVDAGFAYDAGLSEIALELKTSSGIYATSTGLGAAGLSAPATGYPASSFADWSLPVNGQTPQALLFNQWSGSGQQIYPIVTFSYVFLRADMTLFGESGRLATALIKFMFSADAGTPAGSAAETPASPLKFYKQMLMAQPPATVIQQVLTDLRQVQFSPSAPVDWGFETYYLAPGSSSNGYQQYNGFGDRLFSVWRNDYSDYKVTVDPTQVAFNSRAIYGNLVAITNNAASISTKRCWHHRQSGVHQYPVLNGDNSEQLVRVAAGHCDATSGAGCGAVRIAGRSVRRGAERHCGQHHHHFGKDRRRHEGGCHRCNRPRQPRHGCRPHALFLHLLPAPQEHRRGQPPGDHDDPPGSCRVRQPSLATRVIVRFRPPLFVRYCAASRASRGGISIFPEPPEPPCFTLHFLVHTAFCFFCSKHVIRLRSSNPQLR